MSRRFMVFAGVLAIALVVLVVKRPWQRPAPPITIDAPPPYQITAADLEALKPANQVTLRFVVPDSGDFSVRITGSHAGNIDTTSFSLRGNERRDLTKRVPGPFTINTVTIEHGGQTHKKEPNVTIPAGQTREIRIKADGAVEFVTP